MSDEFLTIANESEGLFKDKGSRFLAFAFPVNSEEEIADRLAEVKSRHPKARHHCFAWRLGTHGDRYRSNDDGEPSGTAGKPILARIDQSALTNVLIVVVRYFGGTLLGTGGLIRAYGAAAADAIENARIVRGFEFENWRLNAAYNSVNEVLNILKNGPWEVIKEEYTDEGVQYHIKVRKSHVDELQQKLSGMENLKMEENSI